MDSVDAKQMVEVIGEFQRTQRERLDASKSMLASYALRALLDGANPKELAALCGFVDNEPQEEPVQSSFASAYDALFGRVPLPRIDPVTAFANWLNTELSKMITEAASV